MAFAVVFLRVQISVSNVYVFDVVQCRRSELCTIKQGLAQKYTKSTVWSVATLGLLSQFRRGIVVSLLEICLFLLGLWDGAEFLLRVVALRR